MLSLLKDKILSKNDNVNLIICTTPLQMVIARHIVQIYSDEKFYFLLIADTKNKNEIFDYYFKSLSKFCLKNFSFYISYNQILFLLELRIKGLLMPKINKIFISSIDNISVQTFLNSIKFDSVCTFDDGTANLVTDSYYDSLKYERSKLSINIPYLYDNWLNPKFTTSIIKNLSSIHYTIFKDIPNVIELNRQNSIDMRYICPFECDVKTDTNQKECIKIFIGSPELELQNDSQQIVAHFKINYVINHPRQIYKLRDVEILDTEGLIVEDYILSCLKNNPHIKYHIYTLFSSAALTMRNFNGVKITAVQTNRTKQVLNKNLKTLFQSVGIEILNF
ncbi:hypothetical protein KDE13_08630 [Campylobacter sp. faydin G-140]|uniref:glycosyltransferase family 52 n=1 Tax=Campylobacter anatolicus TaxID=2829105 RepID=UPI001B9DB168|nr:glycosyltransferase family 52 [Campylobacter anatolicus]MBR8466398.1 hypothetical protein [Campylobacter anatolicus]